MKFLDETSRKELNTADGGIGRAGRDGAGRGWPGNRSRRYQELRAKIEALGPVFPDASRRNFRKRPSGHEFLNAQRHHLLDSIRDTEKAIQDIDVESRKRFTEAFQVINNNFREMFKTLFGG